MNYPTRCTHCISLLKNCTSLKNAHYYMIDCEVYIDVEERDIADLITKIEWYQESTSWYYNRLIERFQK